ncbi:hypothetical protein M3Y99_01394300 [Aphelenchoides fujianensis]|nr:hypothetical protein M3Y99_01394300 [Aphelenchoides fujianensis]
MGAGPSVGRNNDELINCLIDNNYIRFRSVEWVMRLVDRGAYFPPDHREDAYKDLAFKATVGDPGCIHLSAPCIYANALEFLNLRPGMAFLNVGSGTGYFNTCAGYLLGHTGTNHGVEIYENLVEYAREHLAAALRTPEAAAFSFCIPEFFVGSAFYVRPSIKYDRIYCGAQVPTHRRSFFGYMLKVGGIMVLPYGSRLIQITRTKEDEFCIHRISTVTFTELQQPNASIERTLHKCVLPAFNPPPLVHCCRTAIRAQLRRAVLNGGPVPTLFEIHRKETKKTCEEVGTQSDPIELDAEDPERQAADPQRDVDRTPSPVNVMMHIVLQEREDGEEPHEEVEHPPQEDGVDVRRPPAEEEEAAERGERMAELFEDVEALMFEAAANEERVHREEAEAAQDDRLEDGLDAELRHELGVDGNGDAHPRRGNGDLPLDDDDDEEDGDDHDQAGGAIAVADVVDEEEVNPAGAAAVMAGAEPNDPNAQPDGRMFRLPAAEEEIRVRRRRIAQMLRGMRQRRAALRHPAHPRDPHEQEALEREMRQAHEELRAERRPNRDLMLVMEGQRGRVEIRQRGQTNEAAERDSGDEDDRPPRAQARVPIRLVPHGFVDEDEEDEEERRAAANGEGGDPAPAPPALGWAAHDTTTPAVFTLSQTAPTVNEVDLAALIPGYVPPCIRRPPAVDSRPEASTSRGGGDRPLRPQPEAPAQEQEERGPREDELSIVDAASFAACLFSMRQRMNEAVARFEDTREEVRGAEQQAAERRREARHPSGSRSQPTGRTTAVEQPEEVPLPSSSGIGIALRNGMKRTMPDSTDATEKYALFFQLSTNSRSGSQPNP